MKPRTVRSFAPMLLASALLAGGLGSVALASDAPRSSADVHLAALHVTVKVEGAHITASATPPDATLVGTAFPGEGMAAWPLARQADGSLMATLPSPAPDTLAVVFSATDHDGKRQEACVMPVDHAGSCEVKEHWLHVHATAGHEYRIERKPDGVESGE